MTVLAVTTATAILSLVGLAIGLGLAVVVVGLFNRVVLPAREIGRYASDIRETAERIESNLAGVDGLVRTRDLAVAVPGLATAYLERVKGALR